VIETLQELGVQQELLARYRGAQATIRLYHATHQKLALLLHKNGERGAIVVAIGCRFVTGPVDWHDAHLTIEDRTLAPDPSGDRARDLHVIDRASGFDVKCSGVMTLAKTTDGPWPEFDSFADLSALLPP